MVLFLLIISTVCYCVNEETIKHYFDILYLAVVIQMCYYKNKQSGYIVSKQLQCFFERSCYGNAVKFTNYVPGIPT